MANNKNKNKNSVPNDDTRDLHKAFHKNKTKGRQREKKYMKDVKDIGRSGEEAYDELDNFERY